MNPRERTLLHARRLAIAAVAPAAVSMAFGCDPAPEPPTCEELGSTQWAVSVDATWQDEAQTILLVHFYDAFVDGTFDLGSEVLVEGGTLVEAVKDAGGLRVTLTPDTADSGATRTVTVTAPWSCDGSSGERQAVIEISADGQLTLI